MTRPRTGTTPTRKTREERDRAAIMAVVELDRKRNFLEVCLCAAIQLADGRVIRGHRHSDCIHAIVGLRPRVEPLDNIQGFLTSRGRFVRRGEALVLQLAAGIKSANGEYRGAELFSEDLY